MQKLYCYVDETGQDTRGEFFLVSAIIVGNERDDLRVLLEEIEVNSGKGRVQWVRTRDEYRLAYISAILTQPAFHGRMFYATYRHSTAYTEHLAQTVQRAINQVADADYKATIVVDGLEGRQKQVFSNRIRSLGVRHKTIRGIRDETDAFIRLADAMCGFARAGLNNHPLYTPLLQQSEEKRFILGL